jgi:hypothetical protein
MYPRRLYRTVQDTEKQLFFGPVFLGRAVNDPAPGLTALPGKTQNIL